MPDAARSEPGTVVVRSTCLALESVSLLSVGGLRGDVIPPVVAACAEYCVSLYLLCYDRNTDNPMLLSVADVFFARTGHGFSL